MFPSVSILTAKQYQEFLEWLLLQGIQVELLETCIKITYLNKHSTRAVSWGEALQFIALCLCHEDFAELGLYKE